MDEPGKKQPPKIDNRVLRHLVIGLVAIAVIFIVGRVIIWQLYASTDSVWQFAINLQLQAQKQETVVKLSQPSPTSHSRMIRQSLYHPDSDIRYTKNRFDGRTIISLVAEKSGALDVDAEFIVHVTEHPRLQLPVAPLSTQVKERYLSDSPELDIYAQTITDFLNVLREKSVDKQNLVDQIYRYVRTFKHKEKTDNPRSASELMNAKSVSVLERSNLFVALCRSAKIPARLVSGFVFREQPDIQPHYWAQIYLDDNWIPYDVYNGYKGELPTNFIPISYNDSEIFTLTNGKLISVDYGLSETRYNYLSEIDHDGSPLNVLNLSRLSSDVRNVLAVLLLLPLGVLITVIFRHFIGIRSYGVFTPSLLALALTRNELTTTFITIAIVCFFALTGRTAFPKKMTRTPRLGIIFILVVLSMGYAVSFVDLYYPSPEGFAVLLPVIILASLTDNFYRTMESYGAEIALIRLAWTAIIMLFCIPVMQWKALGHLLVTFPEAHLLTLAAVLVIGNYKGKQLIKFIPLPLLEGPARRRDKHDDNEL
ncbi:MAG: 7TM domain-containing protein [Thioalkalispiraceae bacterium]|jgi:hypothetical protein